MRAAPPQNDADNRTESKRRKWEIMSIHGDYTAGIIHRQRAKELQTEARKASVARAAKGRARLSSGRGARVAAGRRARQA